MTLLPSKPTGKDAQLEPSRLVLYGQSKVGKTTAVSMIPNNLIVDLEHGTKYIEGAYVIDVVNKSKETDKTELEVLGELFAELAEGKHQFKFITFDTIDWLEQLFGRQVAEMYGVDHYADLEYGKGYQLLRDKLIQFLQAFERIGLNVIVIAHRKKSIIGEADKEVVAKDVDLTGKLKNFLFAWADAIGYMHRIQEEKPEFTSTALSFKTDILESLEGGCRLNHLQSKTVRLITFNTQLGQFVYTNWEEIFPVSINGNAKKD